MRAVFLLLVPLLAGCLSDSDDATLQDVDPLEQHVRQLLGSEGHAKAPGLDDTYLLPVAATPAGGISAYRWTVPDGAVTGHWSDPEHKTIPLEAGFVNPVGKVDSIAIYAFKVGQPLVPLNLYLDARAEMTSRLAIIESTQLYEPALEPFTWSLGYGELRAGDEVLFVIAATTDEPASLGLAFRIMDESRAPDHDPDPIEEILEETPAHGPVVPALVGTGTGFQVAAYLEILFSTAQLEMITGPVEVAHGVRPLGLATPVQDITLGIGHASDEGFTMAFGMYWPDDSAGTIAIDAQARGQVAESEGTFAMVDSGLGTPMVAGIPAWSLFADGAGSSQVDVHIEAASSNEFDILFALQVDLGVSLKTLSGTTVEPLAHAGGTVETSEAYVRGAMQYHLPLLE